MSRRLSLARGGGGVGLAGLVVAAPLVIGSDLWTYELTIVAVNALAVIGLYVVLGLAGQVSFAQTSFMAVGGYGIAILTQTHGWNPWAAFAAAIAIAALAGVVIGFPMLRLRGHYLALGTFALALGTANFASAAQWLTGGSIGIPGVSSFSIGSLSLATPRAFYIFAWLVCGVGLLLAFALSRSAIGRAWRTIAVDESVASTLGIDVRVYKVLAFTVSAIYGAISGGLYVSFTTYANPDLYGFSIVISLFIMLFIGGRGNIFGPLLGTAIVVSLPQIIGGFAAYQQLIFDATMLVIILLRPEGILGRWHFGRAVKALEVRVLASRGGVRTQ